MTGSTLNNQPTVFYDGDCLLCSKSIQFFLKHEAERNIRYTTLTGEYAKKIGLEGQFKKSIPDSIILLEKDKIYTESTASLRLCRRLVRPYNWLAIFLLVPSFIRNIFYRIIARNRYRLNQRISPQCKVIQPEDRSRFIA